MRQLSHHEITIGQPLSFPVYDREGKLLLEAGHVLRNEQQFDALVQRGYVRDAEKLKRSAGPRLADDPLCVSAEAAGPKRTWPTQVGPGLMRLRKELRSVLSEMLKPEPNTLGERIRQLAGHLNEYVEIDADAALASMQLSALDDGTAARAVHSAILVRLVGQAIELPADTLESLTCAALSFDCALAPLANVLNSQRGEPSAEQRRGIHAHPDLSVAALRRAGVDDPIWLETVADHHERLDGSGYPQGLSGDAVPVGARLLALADAYCAMIRPRAYRGAIGATVAMRSLFMERGSKVDEKLAARFIREVGIYPPGTLVKLENNEIAIVLRRSGAGGKPTVCCLIDRYNTAEVARPKRDTSLPGQGIREALPIERYLGLLKGIERLWE